MSPDQLEKLCADVRDVKLAVCGSERLGTPGLVKRVTRLEAWRDNVKLKLAAVSGGAVVLFELGKFALSRL